jgi:uncharacterized protein (TIGR02444 family)
MTVFRFEDHPFWDFSLRIYGSEGVPSACIALQERRGIDVNLLLFSAWIGESGRGVLAESDLESALAATTAWNHDIVCALRVVRNRLKGGMLPIPMERSDVLRKMILEIEVNSEHVEQITLAAVVTRPADSALSAEQRGDDALANVVAYFRRYGFTPDAEDARQVSIVLDPAFPEIGRAALAQASGTGGGWRYVSHITD